MKASWLDLKKYYWRVRKNNCPYRRHVPKQTENGFKSFFFENASEFTVQDTVLNLETRQVIYAMVIEILASQTELCSIYVMCGGVHQTIKALSETGASNKVRLIVHTPTAETRAALDDGLVSMIIFTPANELAKVVISEIIKDYYEGV